MHHPAISLTSLLRNEMIANKEAASCNRRSTSEKQIFFMDQRHLSCASP
nr:MAG TPA: hypothetical protein [Caudoviricetes sp.]